MYTSLHTYLAGTGVCAAAGGAGPPRPSHPRRIYTCRWFNRTYAWGLGVPPAASQISGPNRYVCENVCIRVDSVVDVLKCVSGRFGSMCSGRRRRVSTPKPSSAGATARSYRTQSIDQMVLSSQFTHKLSTYSYYSFL